MNVGRLVLLGLLLTPPSTAIAQDAPADFIVQQTENAATPGPGEAAQAADSPPEPGDVRAFVVDVGNDYKHFLSWSTVRWLSVGTLATAAMLPADEAIREATQGDDAALLSETAGQTYGNLSLQLPLALGWWIAGHAAGSGRAADAGRDLMRAQISAVSWTYVVKYAVDRTRPNGDPRGFPSGHSSAAFATAMVLQEHYGWKLGVPFFSIAAYTAASRIVDNKHWASDVVFAAFLGMTSGRTVTMHVRGLPVSIAPLTVPGGGGVSVRVRRID